MSRPTNRTSSPSIVNPANDGIDGLFVAIDALPNIAQGGAVANVAGGTMSVSHSAFTANQAIGAVLETGGAIANLDGSTLVLDHSVFIGNQATGGTDSTAQGGALYNATGSIATAIDAVFIRNAAIGGAGGSGQGGAAFNDATSTLTLQNSQIIKNAATGGASGIGGGLYLTPGGVACADALMVIVGNDASTSNDDVFGTLGSC